MISFCEERFPTDISYGISGGPSFYTEIVETVSGHEYRNIRYPYARSKYNLANGIKSKEQLDRVVRFFRAMKGRGVAFRFKDWLDFEATKQFIAISDGKQTEYQLIKSYEVSTIIEVRKITKPLKETIKIYGNDKLCHRFTLHDKGMIKLRKALPKNTKITASFEFDVPVRFDSDSLSASLESYEVHSLHDISLIEVSL